ncbi:MAG: hypothetical protein ACO38X_09720, partial [bacterium]
HSNSLLSFVQQNPSDRLQLISEKIRLRNIEMRAEDGTAIKEEDIDSLSVLNSHLLFFDLSTETRTIR